MNLSPDTRISNTENDQSSSNHGDFKDQKPNSLSDNLSRITNSLGGSKESFARLSSEFKDLAEKSNGFSDDLSRSIELLEPHIAASSFHNVQKDRILMIKSKSNQRKKDSSSENKVVPDRNLQFNLTSHDSSSDLLDGADFYKQHGYSKESFERLSSNWKYFPEMLELEKHKDSPDFPDRFLTSFGKLSRRLDLTFERIKEDTPLYQYLYSEYKMNRERGKYNFRGTDVYKTQFKGPYHSSDLNSEKVARIAQTEFINDGENAVVCMRDGSLIILGRESDNHVVANNIGTIKDMDSFGLDMEYQMSEHNHKQITRIPQHNDKVVRMLFDSTVSWKLKDGIPQITIKQKGGECYFYRTKRIVPSKYHANKFVILSGDFVTICTYDKKNKVMERQIVKLEGIIQHAELGRDNSLLVSCIEEISSLAWLSTFSVENENLQHEKLPWAPLKVINLSDLNSPPVIIDKSAIGHAYFDMNPEALCSDEYKTIKGSSERWISEQDYFKRNFRNRALVPSRNTEYSTRGPATFFGQYVYDRKKAYKIHPDKDGDERVEFLGRLPRLSNSDKPTYFLPFAGGEFLLVNDHGQLLAYDVNDLKKQPEYIWVEPSQPKFKGSFSNKESLSCVSAGPDIFGEEYWGRDYEKEPKPKYWRILPDYTKQPKPGV